MTKLLTTRPAADYIRERGISLAHTTLQDWRIQKRGPAWSKVAGRVYYAPEDLDRWIEEKLAKGRRDPLADAAAE